LLAGLAVNIGLLVYFKYFGFIMKNVNRLLDAMGVGHSSIGVSILLPIGISFYSFMSIGYMIDVYRGKVPAERNIAKYALFVSFFPQILAGPIGRAHGLLPQLNAIDRLKLWDSHRLVRGAGMILWGLFIKMVIGDRIAILVNTVYGDYESYGSTLLVLAAIGFSVQIYCDFAGYSYIAIGTARVMGINLMENFNTPYLAFSIQDFWRRWHISLSTWFRDYVYIPIGGSRCSKPKRMFNVLITFIVSGFWHGANWTFIIWGGLHGLYQIAEIQLQPLKNRIDKSLSVKTETVTYRIYQSAATFLLVTFAWIFFKADSVHAAFGIIGRMFTKPDPWVLFDESLFLAGLGQQEFWILAMAVAIMLAADIYKCVRKASIADFIDRQGASFQIISYISIIMMIYVFGIYGSQFSASAFIYFKF
jgi:D-alanyl-lipoteichoic acid acyltransferase DltB (MBOAT superfamily)